MYRICANNDFFYALKESIYLHFIVNSQWKIFIPQN